MARLSKDTTAYANKLEYIQRYNAEHYEKISVQVRKGTRQHYKDMADSMGLSFKEFVVSAMDEYIENHA